MKISILTVAVVLLALACTNPQSSNLTAANRNTAATPGTPANGTYIPTPKPDDGAPRISLADAKKDFDAGSAVFIDTHSAEQFAKQHIQGAINISVSDLAAKEDKIPKGKKIIAYCS